MSDLLMIHPDLEPERVRVLAGEYWPDGVLAGPPPGFREISAAFCGVRVFHRDALTVERILAPDSLPQRARDWVDRIAQSWEFAEVFEARGLDFWIFFRDRFVRWLQELMAERFALERIAEGRQIGLKAVGIDASRRMLLRALSESLEGRLRAEVAFADPPAPPEGETTAERRLRRIFFLIQDAWHGVRFLVEDLLVRRPKVLVASAGACWQQLAGREGSSARTDVHTEEIWRQGRQRRWRVYYRTDSYHPDVGAMTGGRLAPTYLRHFLFLLAQTSRGHWEVRSVQRQWNQLRAREEFREALVFEGLPIAELVIAWLDHVISRELPGLVRDTRREAHFLLGLRPDLLLLTEEQRDNRPLLMVARRLKIPTVALQQRPFHDWDHAYLLPRIVPEHEQGMPDRMCVFGQAAKSFLVEHGGCDPARIAVCGDPQVTLSAGESSDGGTDAGTESSAACRLRSTWGVERQQRVIAVACRVTVCPDVLRWVAEAVGDRSDAFVLIRPIGSEAGSAVPGQRAAAARLRWSHLGRREAVADWYAAIDLLITTEWAEMAAAVRFGTPVSLIEHGRAPRTPEPDAGDLITRAGDGAALREAVEATLERRRTRLPRDAAWERFVTATFGPGSPQAATHVLDVADDLLTRR
ncbi:MAG: hypothetical protein GF330_06355 [Candidatus Eisenbacteria bacterium]|nr:hypothetical protein [Candidatus Eisenbacteria bacterium]